MYFPPYLKRCTKVKGNCSTWENCDQRKTSMRFFTNHKSDSKTLQSGISEFRRRKDCASALTKSCVLQGSYEGLEKNGVQKTQWGLYGWACFPSFLLARSWHSTAQVTLINIQQKTVLPESFPPKPHVLKELFIWKKKKKSTDLSPRITTGPLLCFYRGLQWYQADMPESRPTDSRDVGQHSLWCYCFCMVKNSF